MPIATIDIGTNSVLLLICQKEKDPIKAIGDFATICRLGEGIGDSRQLKPEAMERAIEVLKNYRSLCDQHRVEKIFAVGTAAIRRAENGNVFIQRVKKELGIDVQVISGEKEAELNWISCSTDFGPEIVVIDIGGGSTEMCWYTGKVEKISIPIGTVFLTEKYCHSDPVTDKEFQKLNNAIQQTLQSQRASVPEYKRTIVATAGTATTLASVHQKLDIYQSEKIHGSSLTLAEIQKIVLELKSKTIAERKKIRGLEPKRADVILSGACLLENFVRVSGQSTVLVSDRGVRWGLAYEKLKIEEGVNLQK